MANLFKQCTLEKQIPRGKVIQTSWLPVKYAKPETEVRLREKGEWDLGWKVTSVGEIVLSEDLIPDPVRLVRVHRRRTGDALPKLGP